MQTLEDYTIYCTEKQAIRAYNLGAPIMNVPMYRKDYDELPKYTHANEYGIEVFSYIPTTQQMIGWLEEKIGLNIYCFIANKEERFSDWYCYPIRKDAEYAIINAAFDYLEKNKYK